MLSNLETLIPESGFFELIESAMQLRSSYKTLLPVEMW